jgi:hypothetical protein
MGMRFVLMRLDSFNRTRIPLNGKIGVRFVGLTSRSDLTHLLDDSLRQDGKKYAQAVCRLDPGKLCMLPRILRMMG